jgi:8-oxo-dGTP diphosphatase
VHACDCADSISDRLPRVSAAEQVRQYGPGMDVVAAALIENGRVLAARRVAPPGWEFPGGKVEPGERAEAALERECREELGIEVRCQSLLATASDARIELRLWQVVRLSGTPAALEDHHELRWVGAEELDALDWLPIDRALVGAVRRALGESVRHGG